MLDCPAVRDRLRTPGRIAVRGLAAALLCALVAVAACRRQPTPADPQQPPAAAARPDGSVGAAAENPQCKLFTLAEIASYIGEQVSPGQNAALGAGCQWLAVDGTGDVIVAVVPSSYHEPPNQAPGFKTLTDVGSTAFVAPQLDGWVAGAIVGADAVRVSVAGVTATEATAVTLLKEVVKRRPS